MLAFACSAETLFLNRQSRVEMIEHLTELLVALQQMAPVHKPIYLSLISTLLRDLRRLSLKPLVSRDSYMGH
jgi:hypothetical protein